MAYFGKEGKILRSSPHAYQSQIRTLFRSAFGEQGYRGHGGEEDLAHYLTILGASVAPLRLAIVSPKVDGEQGRPVHKYVQQCRDVRLYDEEEQLFYGNPKQRWAEYCIFGIRPYFCVNQIRIPRNSVRDSDLTLIRC